MFIVKAEVRPTGVGPIAYHLFEAPSVRVGKADCVDLKAITEKAVHLCDLDGMTFKSLGVGYGLEDYSAVYIMNERGKTVDTVHPGPRPQGSTYPVSMTFADAGSGVQVMSGTAGG